MENTKIFIEGLHCAHCAAKIEQKVNKLHYVNSATLNFISKYIIIEHNNYDTSKMYKDVKVIIKKLEPNVQTSLNNLSAMEETNLEETHCRNGNNKHNNRSNYTHNQKHSQSSSYNYNNEHNHSSNPTNSSDYSNEHSHSHGHNYSHSHNLGNNKITLIRIFISVLLFIPTLFLHNHNTLLLVLSMTSYIIVGYDILFSAFKNIINGQVFDENFLMTTASIGAIIVHQYPEAAGVMIFFSIGEYLQDLAVNKSRNQIKSLMNIKPDYANLKIDDEVKKISPEYIKINDIIIIKPGEKIPLDGTIIDGTSNLDTSALTGESLPIFKQIGDEVLSGSINQTGVLTVKVTKPFSESTVSKILNLVENASNKKSKTENFITTFAKYYTPSVIGVAVLIAILPVLLFKQQFSIWLYKSLTFMAVSCPCALVLSIPLSYFSGIGRASKEGILIKGGNYLDVLSKSDIAVFDKTGTLTEGKFEVAKIKSFNVSNEQLLEIAAYGEYYSNHPIAISIRNKYNKKIDKNLINKYEEIAGYGIKAVIDNKTILLGNKKLMEKSNIKYTYAGEQPGTILYIAKDNLFLGYLEISDKIKTESFTLIKKLKNIGINRIVMLTGDNETTANHVKKEIGLKEAYSNLLPIDKVNKIENLIKETPKNKKLLFVGDGINDAPVLTRADVGFAMGAMGSDAAIESADIVIMNDEPSKVVDCIKLAKKTKNIVFQNIYFCLGIKFLVMILTIYTTVKMPLAVFADVGVAIIAILNASRILRLKL